MPIKTESQNSFSGGELGPLLLGRTDMKDYFSSVETATNCHATVIGPMVKRAGTKFIHEVKDSTLPTRLLRFLDGPTNSVVIEAGNQYFRFYNNDAIIGAPLEVTVTPFLTAELFNINYAQQGNMVYFTGPNTAITRLTKSSLSSYTIDYHDPSTTRQILRPAPLYISGSSYTGTLNVTANTVGSQTITPPIASVTGDAGRSIYSLVGQGFATITAAPGGNIIIQVIEAFTSASYATGTWAYTSPVITMTPSVMGPIGTPVTLTASGATPWRTSDITLTPYVAINGGIIKLNTFNSGISVTGTIVSPLTALTASTTYTLQKEIFSSTNGYPNAVSFYQQRLFFGGTALFPGTIWGSAIGDYNNFFVSAADSSSVEFDLVDDEGSTIQWTSSGRELLIGCHSSELTIGPGQDGLLTASSIAQRNRGQLGSSTQTPIRIDNQTIFVQLNDTRIRALEYNFQNDAYETSDITIKAPHITGTEIIETAYADQPDKLFYALRADGKLAVACLDKSQGIVGWSLYETDGIIESICTIPNGEVDELWMIVNRTINGATKRYVEILDNGDGTGVLDSFFDCSLHYSVPKNISAITKANPGVVTSTAHGFANGDIIKFRDMEGMTEIDEHTYTVANVAANTFELSNTDTGAFGTFISGTVYKTVTSITGLTHLEGATVGIKGDGANLGTAVVTAGVVALPSRVAEAVIGLPYTMTLKTLKREFNIGQGTMQNQNVRFIKTFLRVYASTIPTLNGSFIPSRDSSMLMDTAVPLYSGNLNYGNLDWDRNGQMTIEDTSGFPLNILAIYSIVDGHVM